MDDKTELKRMAAKAAVSIVPEGNPIGIGSGSTVQIFIEELAKSGIANLRCVSSSEDSRICLENAGFKVIPLAEGYPLPIYFDGADEIDLEGRMIKGGGGALTKEKIIAGASQKFVCMVDESKVVQNLGGFPLPIEVIPMALTHVMQQIKILGGSARERVNCITDNGNVVIDVAELDLSKPKSIEEKINNIAGVVTNGIFAFNKCNELFVGTGAGVEVLSF